MVSNIQRFSRPSVWLSALLVIAACSGASLSFASQDRPAAPGESPTKNSAPQTSSPSKAPASQAQQTTRPKMKTFSSPEEAAAALVAAARNHDEDGMLVILGRDAKDVIVWTDAPEDRKSDADLFVQKYGQMHRLVREPDNETTLY